MTGRYVHWYLIARLACSSHNLVLKCAWVHAVSSWAAHPLCRHSCATSHACSNSFSLHYNHKVWLVVRASGPACLACRMDYCESGCCLKCCQKACNAVHFSTRSLQHDTVKVCQLFALKHWLIWCRHTRKKGTGGGPSALAAPSSFMMRPALTTSEALQVILSASFCR